MSKIYCKKCGAELELVQLLVGYSYSSVELEDDEELSFPEKDDNFTPSELKGDKIHCPNCEGDKEQLEELNSLADCTGLEV